jgi:glycerol-3-phosphate dehydrogenase (NAD(P)+)
MQFGVIGSGSWATAIVKMLTDNRKSVNWWVRSENVLKHINARNHNPGYLSSVNFNPALLSLSNNLESVINQSDALVIAVPSAYLQNILEQLPKDVFEKKHVISAVKGMLPANNQLLNDYLRTQFNVPLENYFTIMGPCHAEEVAAEKLSYLTFSGIDELLARTIATSFETPYINTVINPDVYGVQYAAILKNIYALGAGIAHGLEYGDNFFSVFIANCADEMAGFLLKTGIRHMEVGIHDGEDPVSHKRSANYAASVYLGDLLVTCYSLFSRNRSFGNMIGKGYSVRTAQLELNMVAEGYNASKCIYLVNRETQAPMPIAETIYRILWENVKSREGFKQIEPVLV